jgi:ABC-2 type transport system ATP-binding protein
MILSIKNLSKSLGQQAILNNLSVTIQSGSIVGLIGKNGAGKSTFLNCLSNIIQADMEDIYVDDKKVKLSDSEWKKNLGFVSDIVPVIEEFTILEYLKFVGVIYQIPENDITSRALELYNYFFDESSLLENKKPLKSFSTGMLKKVQIISSIIHKPTLLLLDEPFSGLDAVTSSKLISFVKHYSNANNIVIFTTHDLNHHKSLGTHFLILDKAQIIFQGDFKNLDSSYTAQETLAEIHGKQLNFKWL